MRVRGMECFRGGCFQAGGFNNQSVNLFRSRSQVTSALAVVSQTGGREPRENFFNWVCIILKKPLP